MLKFFLAASLLLSSPAFAELPTPKDKPVSEPSESVTANLPIKCNKAEQVSEKLKKSGFKLMVVGDNMALDGKKQLGFGLMFVDKENTLVFMLGDPKLETLCLVSVMENGKSTLDVDSLFKGSEAPKGEERNG